MRKIVFVVILFLANYSFGQGLQMEVKLEMAATQKIYLAHYYLDNIYLDDSLQLDANGSGVFRRDTLLPEGLYKIYRDKDNHFDFLLCADQQFLLTNNSYSVESLKIEGAKEAEAFVKYLVFLKDLQTKSSELRKEYENANGAEKEKIKAELNGITSKLHQYWFDTLKNYPGSFLSKFLLANYVPELDITTLPEAIQKNDSLLLLAKFNYQQKHFWDYFDYADERFLYTPLLKPKMETWFAKVLYQNYDSVQPAVFDFIEKVRPNKRIFQFAASWFLNSSINSNILGMDALFIDLANAYYLSGEAFWASEETMKIIRENVLFIEPNLIGKTAPDLTLESVDGEFVNLHKIKSKITMVLIFEPNCSHCKEFVPKLHDEVYEKYKNKGLTVYSIYSMDNKEEWVEFLGKHNLYDWINVWDENHVSRFKILYDARKTPGIYVLDENKKIMAKKLSVEQLSDMLNDLL